MRAFGICFVLAMAALASVSRAGIIVGTGPDANPIVTAATVDLDGDGQPDIQATSMAFGSNDITSVSPATGSTLQFTDALTTGTVVNDSLTFSSTGGLREVADRFSQGGFADGDYGFRFTSGGATHYGWADLYASAGINISLPTGTAGVSHWAYESDPNTPITVGAVPEPATAALLLVTLAFFPRRRSA